MHPLDTIYANPVIHYTTLTHRKHSEKVCSALSKKMNGEIDAKITILSFKLYLYCQLEGCYFYWANKYTFWQLLFFHLQFTYVLYTV